MAHIKMQYRYAVCDASGLHADCDGWDEGCDDFAKVVERSQGRVRFGNCEHFKVKTAYRECELRRFAVTEGEPGYGLPFTLHAGRREYGCEYLAIDGVTYCDERGEKAEATCANPCAVGFSCSECGATCGGFPLVGAMGVPWRYCPACGAKVVEP